MKRYYLALSLLLSLPINIIPQSAGGNLMLGFPQGEFKDNIDRLGFGLSGEVLFFNSSERLPFGFGLNVGYMNYGSESRQEPFSLPAHHRRTHPTRAR